MYNRNTPCFIQHSMKGMELPQKDKLRNEPKPHSLPLAALSPSSPEDKKCAEVPTYATPFTAPKCTHNKPQRQTDTLLSTTSQQNPQSQIPVPLATNSDHVTTHDQPVTQCTTSFPSQYSEITASSLGKDTAKTAQASLSPEKSTPADEKFPSPSPAAGTAECGAGQKPQSTLHYTQMDFSKLPKMQTLPPPQTMPSAENYSEIRMPVPAS